MCRKRFSVWCRQATKDNKIVNEDLWARIQAQFPDQVKAALEGNEEVVAEEGNIFVIFVVNSILIFYFPVLLIKYPDFPAVTNHQFAEPGELKKEYEAEQARLRQEEEEQRKKEEKASADILAELAREQVNYWLCVATQISGSLDKFKYCYSRMKNRQEWLNWNEFGCKMKRWRLNLLTSKHVPYVHHQFLHLRQELQERLRLLQEKDLVRSALIQNPHQQPKKSTHFFLVKEKLLL
jgi:hypothetical protein